jgi:transmembrane sensor
MKENPYENMDKVAHRIAFLVASYIRGTISEKDHDELDAWINESDQNMKLFEDLTDEKNLEANLAWMDQVNSGAAYNQLQQSGAFNKRKSRAFRVWIAAAFIILLIGLFFILRFTIDNKQPEESSASSVKDLNPGGNKATLTFSDGSVIDLSSIDRGLLKKEQGAEVSKKTDGQLVYASDHSGNEVERMDILSTPFGGQYQVTLSDGTKVWLNAASTLKYPARFGSKDRTVSIEGEAYFEVAKNPQHPFHVILPDSSTVSVLGTHFDVMSYNNENSKNITLLEGSVKVQSGIGSRESVVIKPGQQAIVTKNSELRTQNPVDTDEVIGWKNGLFVFRDAPIESIMRQIERWYDAKVEYKDQVNLHLNATIERNVPVSKLLHIFQETRQVKFEIEGKKIIVMK